MKPQPIVLALLFAAAAAAQTAAPDCQFTATLTSTTPSTPTANKSSGTGGTPCVYWSVSYWTNGATGVSVQLEGAADAAGAPTGSYTALTAAAGSNPMTGTTAGSAILCCDYYPWLRVNPGTFNGTTKTMIFRAYGWRAPASASAAGQPTNNPAFTGTLTVGNNITLTSVQAATPAAPSIVTVGTPGVSTYKYAVIAVTVAGGIMGPSATIDTGNATLNNTNFLRITIPAVTGATGCLIYRFLDGNGAAYGNGPLTDLDGNFTETFPCGTTIDDPGRNGWFFTDFDWATGPTHTAGIAAPTYASTGAGVGSEQFGFMANAYGSEANAFGWGASANSNGLAFGSNTVAGISGSVFGYNAHADNGGISIGASATAAASGIVLGTSSTAATEGIAIGVGIHAAENQVVVGRSFQDEQYFGWNGGSQKAFARIHSGSVQLENVAVRPTCDATTRGLIWSEKGTGASGADVPLVCIRSDVTGPVYSWAEFTYTLVP